MLSFKAIVCTSTDLKADRWSSHRLLEVCIAHWLSLVMGNALAIQNKSMWNYTDLLVLHLKLCCT